MKIKGAIFDMDGTLVDSLGFWNILWRKVGAEYLGDEGFRPSEEDDKKVRTMLLKDAMELIHKNYNAAKSGEELSEFANDTIIDFYENVVVLKQGVKEFLEYLKNKNVKMCIASATEKSLVELVLNHCGIKEYFPKLISCADIGKGKDSPEVFVAALEYLGTSINDTWVFEDSLVAIKTAADYGLKTVGIYDENNFGQDEIKEISEYYIDKNESLLKLI
ncbi:MAG: HAD family phosphatase [Monoglobales bacterium]